MLARKILAGCFLTSLLAFTPARGQQASSSIPIASPVGLLLARVAHQRNRDAFGDVSMVRYETLWIVRDASGAHITATLPDVIVPRQSGFWRIGIEHTCQLTPAAQGDSSTLGNISTADVPYAVPAGQAPVVELDHAACDSETAKRLFDDSYNPEFVPDPDSEHPPNPSAPSECGWANRWFVSILPDLISISYFQGVSEICEPEGGNDYKEIWVQRPEDPFPFVGPAQQQIPFDVVFGAAGHHAWIHAVSGGQSEGDSCIADNPDEDMPQTGWSLKHVHGEWRTHAFAQVGRVCAASGDPKVVAPRTLTHAIPLPIPWTELEKQLPGISDAYVAPGASGLLAIQSTKGDPVSEQGQTVAVALYDFSGNKLAAKLLDLPATKIVMAEWATGRFVQSWTESLSALQAHGLPAVVVKVRAAFKEPGSLVAAPEPDDRLR
jgi:hypothetical protein